MAETEMAVLESTSVVFLAINSECLRLGTMKRDQILERITAAPEIAARAGLNRESLVEALENINSLIELDSMNDDQTSNFVQWIRMLAVDPPDTNSRPFLKKVSDAIGSLKALVVFEGPAFDLYGSDRLVPELIERLEHSVEEYQRFNRSGRPYKLSWSQASGAQKIARLFEAPKPKLQARWTTDKIRELGGTGQFAYVTSDPQELFNPSAARLISNLCWSLGSYLGETAIINSLKKFDSQKQSFQEALMDDENDAKQFPNHLDYYRESCDMNRKIDGSDSEDGRSVYLFICRTRAPEVFNCRRHSLQKIFSEIFS